MEKKIDRFEKEYFYLSNFYNVKICYEGLIFENAEAAFQAQKTHDENLKKRFCKLNPSEAKKLGRRVKLIPTWEAIKILVMYEVVLAKFSQNRSIMDKLISTGNVYLEEGNDWGDKFWGTVNGEGRNELGKILMKVRDELREKNKKIYRVDRSLRDNIGISLNRSRRGVY